MSTPKPKISYRDEDGTSMNVTLERDGRLRFITDADKSPPGNGVWLTDRQVELLIVDLAGLLFKRKLYREEEKK